MDVHLIAVLSIILLTYAPSAIYSIEQPQQQLLVEMTLVQNASAIGAYCLDGSLPAYHLHRGFGSGACNWLLQFEGGGWCNDIQSCSDRAKTHRGSTRYMTKWEVFSGILSNNASQNPDFYNWNRVKLRYCDGASFGGDAKFDNGRAKDLAGNYSRSSPKRFGPCQKGGLATFLHCDNFTSYLPRKASVKCLSDAGFFLDVRDITLNYTMRSFYKKLISLQGIGTYLNKTCMISHCSPEQCFFPQYALSYIRTPFFILNSAYDVFQFHHGLVPPSADLQGRWQRCKLVPAACNPNQINILQGFRNYMIELALSSFVHSRGRGMFINSCFSHCQSESQDTWLAANSPEIHNKTIAEAVGDWYFGRRVSIEIDCPYPCDTTCHNLIGA